MIDDHRLAYVSRGAGQLVPRAGHRAGQRGGHPGRPQRARQLPGLPAQPEAVDDADHRVRRPPDRRPGHAGLARAGQADAAQLDRPLHAARTSTSRSTATTPIQVFTTRPDTLFGATYMVLAPEHELVDALIPAAWPDGHRRRPGPAGTRRPAEAVAAYRARGRGQDRGGAHRRRQGQDRRLHRRVRDQPGQRRARSRSSSPTTCWPATAPARSWRCPARTSGTGTFAEAFDLPVDPHRRDARGLRGRLHRRRAGDQLASFLDGLGVAEAKAAMIAWLEEQRPRHAAPPPTGCATGCSAGSATGASRSRSSTTRPACRSRCPSRCCRSSCPRSTTSRRAPSTRTTRTASPETPLSRKKDWVDGRAGPGRRPEDVHPRDQHHAAVGRLLLVRAALPGPAQRRGASSTRRTRRTGWARSATATAAASTCTSAASSTPCCTCCTPASGTRCCSTWATCRRSSRSASCSTRATSRRTRSATPAASSCPPRRSSSATARGSTATQEVTREYGKMGKSLKNVVTPDEMCDAVRRRHVPGVRDGDGPAGRLPPVGDPGGRRLAALPAAGLAPGRRRGDRRGPGHRRAAGRRRPAGVLHRIIDGVREDMDELRFNTAIAKLIELTNTLTPLPAASREAVEPLVLMMSPFAPHLAEELWRKLGHDGTLAYADFPVADPAQLVAESITYPVQVNGKVRGRVEVAPDADRGRGTRGGAGRRGRGAGRPRAPQGHRGQGPPGQRRRLTLHRKHEEARRSAERRASFCCVSVRRPGRGGRGVRGGRPAPAEHDRGGQGEADQGRGQGQRAHRARRGHRGADHGVGDRGRDRRRAWCRAGSACGRPRWCRTRSRSGRTGPAGGNAPAGPRTRPRRLSQPSRRSSVPPARRRSAPRPAQRPA